ncbi:EndoS/ChiA family endoglycosidase [Pedobacter punctiformis]|uniref:mannosyl-glycoprotein endo-beta-N-acetylglucosaminidase n=1 Tax=Pedobacter punctiformis TaxID=3004097 RepID=A0ABT4LC24_9SPHI|nr:RICIN domain-containing protein [Pedobacter sp. HCMS5-2]MCZ4245457.1 RICIN domain-containing protein [Pedobacter sp. HCMS5-2]
MKKLILVPAFALIVGSFFLQSCKKNDQLNSDNPAIGSMYMANSNNQALSATSNPDLIAYKQSNHQISAAFFRVFKDVTNGGAANVATFSSLPDSLDIAIAFVFNNNSPVAVKNAMKNTYIPALHAKGTKVIVTGNLDIPSGVAHNAAGYNITAKLIMDSIVNKYGFDGYDIDVESNPTGSTLTDMVGVYKALSQYLGPKSGTTKLLTFDTNQDGNNNMFRQVYDLVNYVWLQAYGRPASSLQNTWNTFSPYIPASKFIPGFSFYEENGYPSNVWYDVSYPRNGTGRAYDFANWQPSGTTKGGVFSYATDRDCNLSSSTDNSTKLPDYRVTNDLIKIMNPVTTSSGIVSGSTYQLISALNNSSVLDVTASGTTDGTLAELWSANNPKTNNQKWKVVSVGSGYYKLQPLNAPTKALDVSASGTADGTQIQIYTDNATNAQKWKITSTGDGYYTLSPANAPSKNLDVNNSSTANGTKIQIWTPNGTNAQKWKFVLQ